MASPRALLCAWAALAQVVGEPLLFVDLDESDLAPRNWTECNELSSSVCLTEFHSGRFDGAQQYRSMAFEEATAARLQPPKLRLLVLVTTVWRNRQRRRILRRALRGCAQWFPADSLQFRFLLGAEPPASLLAVAAEEAAANEDMMVLPAIDEMNYAHVGDAYELRDANPELVKIVVALRALLRQFRMDYVLVADDDSFISVPSALELVGMLPTERVLVGNMIDSIPQRYDAKIGTVRPEYSVNLYLAAPSKVPVFPHGMGFIVSQDVARLLADIGLSFKARGNDDMLIGTWLRSVEHMYYLHYWPLFHDHKDFQGVFSKDCDPSAVVVHRMTPERWQTFDPHECHICGPPSQPLDVEPGGNEGGAAGASDEVVTTSKWWRHCTRLQDLGCDWEPSLLERARAWGPSACVGWCQTEARANYSARVVPVSGVRFRRRNYARVCPVSLCHAYCMSGINPLSYTCPPGTESRKEDKGPALAVLIFGSRWGGDRRLRNLLRAALLACESPVLGTSGVVRHLFVMAALPHANAGTLRRESVEELLQHRDLAVSPSRAGVAYKERHGGEDVSYAYADAWRLVEERFGQGTEYFVLLDHRSYVNVPSLVHMVLPQLPRSRIFLGCLLDETLYTPCEGPQANERCTYLRHRRAPLFAHGMGFVVSADVARFVHDFAARMPLREDDIPVDTAFGMWLQALEDVRYDSLHDQFHEWPRGEDAEAASAARFLGGGPDLSRPPGDNSVVVFPMTEERWLLNFDAQSCSLRRQVA